MGIDAGRRNRHVIMQQLAESTSTTGYPVDTWTELCEPWMEKRDLSGRERFTGIQQLSSPFDTEWIMAYRADCDPDLVDVPKKRRIVYQGRSFDIVFAEHLGVCEDIKFTTLAKGKIEA